MHIFTRCHLINLTIKMRRVLLWSKGIEKGNTAACFPLRGRSWYIHDFKVERLKVKTGFVWCWLDWLKVLRWRQMQHGWLACCSHVHTHKYIPLIISSNNLDPFAFSDKTHCFPFSCNIRRHYHTASNINSNPIHTNTIDIFCYTIFVGMGPLREASSCLCLMYCLPILTVKDTVLIR